MRLSAVLFRGIYYPGRMWTGKHRKIMPVTACMKRNALKRAELIKQNEALLSKPYLTAEEDHNSVEGRSRQRFEELKRQAYLRRTLGEDKLGLGHTLPDGSPAPSFLDHLNVTRTEHK